jgi:hypothetical protein
MGSGFFGMASSGVGNLSRRLAGQIRAASASLLHPSERDKRLRSWLKNRAVGGGRGGPEA